MATAVLFPGQGSQYKGMGHDLFPRYAQEVRLASEVLGYDISKLCLEDPDSKINQTEFAQPAIFLVNTLYYQELQKKTAGVSESQYFAGHSLGEFNALMAAGAFDFSTGLRLVQKRGQLMGQSDGGGMAAIVGPSLVELENLISEHPEHEIQIVNYNTPSQHVIAGKKNAVSAMMELCATKNMRSIALNVSAAFHSRHMLEAQKGFAQFLDTVEISDPKLKVISNVSARAYEVGQVKELLTRQLANPVRWVEIVQLLMGKGVEDFKEVHGSILSNMVREVQAKLGPIFEAAKSEESTPTEGIKRNASLTNFRLDAKRSEPIQSDPSAGLAVKSASIIRAEELGSQVFRERYRTKYAYASGSMYRGIASPELVIRMGRAGYLGYYGTGGLPLTQVKAGIRQIKSAIADGAPFGANLLANIGSPQNENQLVELMLKEGVRNIEASAYVLITKALVRYRVSGLERQSDGKICCRNNVMAKVSRPEIARAFMSPPPAELVKQLLTEGEIMPEQAKLAASVPMAHDICVEADSGGHTDGRNPMLLVPSMIRLRNTLAKKYNYSDVICIGQAGGIGTPEAAAAAFILGADFVLTGSINQCTVEAATSNCVKDMLQSMDIQDTDYCPAGDMFEMGARVQVLKKGVFFPARGNKLFALYQNYDSWKSIPKSTRETIEISYFKMAYEEVWNSTRIYMESQGKTDDVLLAEEDLKFQMALVFRWYFYISTELAIQGDEASKVNFQVQCGPAQGSFNRWVEGTPMVSWKNRHSDEIARQLMEATAEYLSSTYSKMFAMQALSACDKFEKLQQY